MKLCPQCGRTLLDGLSTCPDDGTKLAVPGQILRGAPVGVASSSNLRKVADNHSPPWTRFAVAGGVGLVAIAGLAFIAMRVADSQAVPAPVSVDQLIQSGQSKKALAILKKWKSRNIQTKADSEKLNDLLMDMAATATDQQRFQDAAALLTQVDVKSPQHKEAQQLMEGLRAHGSIGFASGHSPGVK